MTIEQLRADYEDLKECSHYPAMERIMSAMPMMLDVLEATIAWRDANGTHNTHHTLCNALDDWL